MPTIDSRAAERLVKIEVRSIRKNGMLGGLFVLVWGVTLFLD
jgi:hypothetical protein